MLEVEKVVTEASEVMEPTEDLVPPAWMQHATLVAPTEAQAGLVGMGAMVPAVLTVALVASSRSSLPRQIWTSFCCWGPSSLREGEAASLVKMDAAAVEDRAAGVDPLTLIQLPTRLPTETRTATLRPNITPSGTQTQVASMDRQALRATMEARISNGVEMVRTAASNS